MPTFTPFLSNKGQLVVVLSDIPATNPVRVKFRKRLPNRDLMSDFSTDPVFKKIDYSIYDNCSEPEEGTHCFFSPSKTERLGKFWKKKPESFATFPNLIECRFELKVQLRPRAPNCKFKSLAPLQQTCVMIEQPLPHDIHDSALRLNTIRLRIPTDTPRRSFRLLESILRKVQSPRQ